MENLCWSLMPFQASSLSSYLMYGGIIGELNYSVMEQTICV